MASPAPHNRSLRLIPIIGAILVAVILICGIFYLNRSIPPATREVPPTPEAKAYVGHLKLSNVTVKAAENLMNQRVVEVDGNITNTGPRSLQTVDIYCFFYGVNGREVDRERLPIVAQATPLKAGETRPFRLPFDTLPDTWNQAVPGMVIARIVFAR